MTSRLTSRVMLAVDVAYRDDDGGTHARAAALVFTSWTDDRAIDELVVHRRGRSRRLPKSSAPQSRQRTARAFA